MDLGRLLRPRSVAVVGATERAGSYAGETLVNLNAAGFEGPVWGVNPKRSEAHGRPCFPSLAELPGVPDAVVVGIPAAGVAEVVDEAGALGCGGAVVYGAGFGEVASGAAHELALAEAAARHSLPVCGPNGNGIVALHSAATLWGDALRPLEPGSVALVSQSGNVAVNALATRRGLRFHTVVSCGNSVAVDPAAWVAELARDDRVRAIALYLEADGGGAELCEALALCAERGVGVAVLKVGVSAAGAAAAAAHTGAVAGDQRVFRALVEEAGAAWAADVHDLLELAKAMAVPAPPRQVAAPPAPPRQVAAPPAPPRQVAAPGSGYSDRALPPGDGDPPAGGLAVLTCSGGDSALAADECERLGVALPALGADAAERLRGLLPEAATVGNPLDYTALIWGDAERLRDIVVAVGDDPSVERILVLYDQAAELGAAERSWAAVRDGIRAGAAASAVPVMVASTLPELLDEKAALEFMDAGVPAVAGLRTGLACAAALAAPAADPARLREIAAATRRVARPAAGGDARRMDAAAAAGNGLRWLAEHEAKELLRSAGIPVARGRVAVGEDDVAAAFAELGGPVALKLSSPSLRHKADLGALVLGIATEDDARAAHRRLAALEVEGASVLVELMASPGEELLVAARADAVVPCLTIGAGGIWTEALGDATVVPLPATAARVEAALRGLRAAALLAGGRGRPALDIRAAARLAAAAGDLLLERGLELLELNPVLVHEEGAVAVDALAAAR